MNASDAAPQPKHGPLERTRLAFERMGLTRTLGITLTHLEPGVVEVQMPFSEDVLQQRGSVHAGALTTMLDTACGFAAGSLMPDGSDVVSVEFKVNFLSPAVGERFRARATVTRSGRSISVTQGELFAVQNNQEKLVAVMLATMMRVDAQAPA